MAKSVLNKLEEIINNPTKFGISKNMLAYNAIELLYNYNKAYVNKQYDRYARHISVNKFGWQVERVLNLAGIKYELCNDAPRGGQMGDFIKIAVKSFKPAKYDKNTHRGTIIDGKYTIVKL